MPTSQATKTLSILIPPNAVTWLVDTLDNAPDQIEERLAEFTAPAGLPERLIEALDTKLSTAVGLARWAYLVGTVSETGVRSHLLGFVGAIPASTFVGHPNAVEQCRHSWDEKHSIQWEKMPSSDVRGKI